MNLVNEEALAHWGLLRQIKKKINVNRRGKLTDIGVNELFNGAEFLGVCWIPVLHRKDRWRTPVKNAMDLGAV